jgi:hypothetical protein
MILKVINLVPPDFCSKVESCSPKINQSNWKSIIRCMRIKLMLEVQTEKDDFVNKEHSFH